MRTRIGAAAVLALAIMGGDAVVVGADAPGSAPSRRGPGRGPASARGKQTPTPGRADARHQSLLDQLDDARINCDLQEMEVAADKMQIQKMMTLVRETELTPTPVVSVEGLNVIELPGRVDLEAYKRKLDRVCADFVIKSKELSQERRRLAELEAELGLTAAALVPPAAAPEPARAVPSLAEAERVLDLILRGVESWQRANPPALDERSSPPPVPRPAPEDRPLKDAERLLDLLRRGIESWRRDPADSPEERLVPEERPRAAPRSEPDPDLLKDAERLLDLIRRGVDAWQGQRQGR